MHARSTASRVGRARSPRPTRAARSSRSIRAPRSCELPLLARTLDVGHTTPADIGMPRIDTHIRPMMPAAAALAPLAWIDGEMHLRVRMQVQGRGDEEESQLITQERVALQPLLRNVEVHLRIER